jgi:hypothetical protein
MPFGLEALPLHAMGLGVELMVRSAQSISDWPGAVTIMPDISGTALVLVVLGGLWLCLWQTRLRALGLVIAAAGLALAPAHERPDVLIERDGATAALRSQSGDLVFPPATAATYSVENWLLVDATTATLPRCRKTPPFVATRSAAWAGSRQDRCAYPPLRSLGRGLPHRRHRHCALRRVEKVPRRPCYCGQAQAQAWRRACPLYRWALYSHRYGD